MTIKFEKEQMRLKLDLASPKCRDCQEPIQAGYAKVFEQWKQDGLCPACRGHHRNITLRNRLRSQDQE